MLEGQLSGGVGGSCLLVPDHYHMGAIILRTVAGVRSECNSGAQCYLNWLIQPGNINDYEMGIGQHRENACRVSAG